jgi:hypothetical protein
LELPSCPEVGSFLLAGPGRIVCGRGGSGAVSAISLIEKQPQPPCCPGPGATRSGSEAATKTVRDGCRGCARHESGQKKQRDAHNQAVGGAGGLGGNGSGGGVFLGATEGTVTPSLAVSNSNINSNRADGGAGGAGGSTGSGVGGGVYNLGDLTTARTVIEGKHASTSNADVFP